MEEHEVNRLLNRLIDGSISTEDFARIQAVMRVNPEVREEYYDLIGLDLLLSESYEVPTHISVQAEAMHNDHWVAKRSKHKVIKIAVWAAAACLMLSLGSFYLFRDKGPPGTLTPSSICRFSVDGNEVDFAAMKPGEVLALKKDELLEVKEGVLNVKVGPNVDVCVEAPTRLKLIAQEGKLELQEGKAFFSILPGGKGFEVHTPGGILRDIGTKFGVEVTASGQIETHVTEGTIVIDRGDGTKREIREGSMAVWSGMTGSIRSSLSDGGSFVENLPSKETIFDDDFNDPDGTPIHNKKPDVGLPWKTEWEYNLSAVEKGVLDTSKGPRLLRARFKEGVSTEKRKLYVVNFSTRPPGNIWDKAGYEDANERITFLHSQDASPLFSLEARMSRHHQWQIKNEAEGVSQDRLYSVGSQISVLQPHDLTLTYDSASGEVRFYEGKDTRGNLADKPFKVEAGHSLDSILISNQGGGDVALENLTVRMLTYPQSGSSAGTR